MTGRPNSTAVQNSGQRVLRMEGISKSFSGVPALVNVKLEVAPLRTGKT